MMPDARRLEAPFDYDAIVVGSGAGGAAAAYGLAQAGLKVALVEKGSELPRDGSTLDFNQVVHAGLFKSQEPWLDRDGRRFSPEEHFNVGGKTRWYGAALLRYGRHEFLADPDHQCPAWPIAYDDLAGYYAQAERLLGVRQFECEPDLRIIANRLARRAPWWQAEPIPLGLSGDILGNALEARHFDGFASVAGLKGDAETAFLDQVRTAPTFALLTGTPVVDLLPHGENRTRIGGVRLANGRVLRARAVFLAAGALHSPRILQRYIDDQGLAARLPAARHVGRNLKMHLLTAMVAISPGRKADLLRKTMIFLNEALPHSSVQPLGFDGELISSLIPALVPRLIARPIGERAYGFFLQTEDGASEANCVRPAHASTQGLPQLDYDPRRTPAAWQEHNRLVRSFRNALARTGMIAFSQRIGVAGTAHVSGTLVAGHDASDSVVDARGRVHGLDSLYVVDGSILPRSSRVNPSLTIYAWSLRVADLFVRRLAAEASVLESTVS
jgi:choline dehydrogenase-like flavoprotein